MSVSLTNHLAPPQEPLPDNDALYEIVDGQVVEVPPMGAKENLVGSFLVSYLGAFTRTHGLGLVFVEQLHELAKKLCRRPDLSFVRFSQWRQEPASRRDAWPVVPALAIEVVSPSNSITEVSAKIADYLKHGVEVVWVVFPDERKIQVHRADEPDKIHVIRSDGVLEDPAMFPGFRLPMVELFACLDDDFATKHLKDPQEPQQ